MVDRPGGRRLRDLRGGAHRHGQDRRDSREHRLLELRGGTQRAADHRTLVHIEFLPTFGRTDLMVAISARTGA